MSRKGSGRARDSCLIPFHYYNTNAMTAGSLIIFANPSSLSLRAGIEADAWAHFRLKRLSFRLHVLSPANGARAAGFVGGIQDTPPTTVTQVMELLPSVLSAAGQSVPSEWVSVPKTDLSGPFPWYKTVAGAADVTEEQPGEIVIAGSGTDVVNLEIRGVFEFKTSVATGNTPLAAQLRLKAREERVSQVMNAERNLLLKILGSSPTAGVSSKTQNASV